MGMSRTDLREAYAYFANTKATADVDRHLNFALRMLARKFNTYTARWFVRVPEGKALYNRADIVPTLEQSANGEGVGELLSAQYQRGDSGDIASISAASVLGCTEHDLSNGDVVELHNTGDPVGTTAGAAFTCYDAPDQTVSSVVADTSFKLSGVTYDASYNNDRGVYIRADDYKRHILIPLDWFEVEREFTNVNNPTATEVPEGVLILHWQLIPPKLSYLAEDTTILPDWILNSAHHETLAFLAAELANNPKGIQLNTDKSAELVAYNPILADMIDNIRRNYIGETVDEEPQPVGRFRFGKGAYCFRNRAQGALMIYANNCW